VSRGFECQLDGTEIPVPGAENLKMEKYTASMKTEMLRRKFSKRTIDSYLFCISKFLGKIKKAPRKITKNDVKDYLDSLALRNKSGSTINVYYCSIKFLLEEVLRRNIKLDFRYSRRPKSLPEVLSKEEVKALFGAIQNKTHRLMAELLYSSGMRVSELLNLKVRDLELDSGHGWIRKGKGGKDRPFVVAESIKNDLINHIACNKLADCLLFPKHPRTIQEIVRKAAKKAGIMKNVHPHTLRHSFATHLIQNKYNVSDVQSLLGHSSMQTTMVYVHLAAPRLFSVKSPLDSL
jgi:integrase/recombinase XerD